MKLHQLYSATTIVQEKDTKILTDPWLVGEEYFGSWGMFPKYNFNKNKFEDIDYIYISHIHPDHFSINSLKLLNKKIPILIHDYKRKFLKAEIEKLGFKVIELKNYETFDLGNDLKMKIFSSDCKPALCENTLGCPMNAIKDEQIDSMAVFNNGKTTLVNTNDCPYAISSGTAKAIKEYYNKIDLVMLGYTTASSYPHCFVMDEQTMKAEANKKMMNKLNGSVGYLEIFKPDYFIPFAGRFVLTGKNFELNKFRGEPDLEIAFDWLTKNYEFSRGILLNHDECFDLEGKKQSKEYRRLDQESKWNIIQQMFGSKKYDYELVDMPNEAILCENIIKANSNFQKKRIERGISKKINILIKINEEYSICISCEGSSPKIVKKRNYDMAQPYIMIMTDLRLLDLMLKRKVNWSIADIGSHLRYERKPDIYIQGIFSLLNHLVIN